MSPEELAAIVDRAEYDKAADIISGGFDIDEPDQYGRTALMYAVLSLGGAKTESVEFLLRNGANPNVADGAQQWTTLHFSARDNRLGIVKLLIENGADVDPVDMFGNTPLWRCVMNCGKDYAVADVLLKAGADPRLKNKYGSSALDILKSPGLDELRAVLSACPEAK